MELVRRAVAFLEERGSATPEELARAVFGGEGFLPMLGSMAHERLRFDGELWRLAAPAEDVAVLEVLASGPNPRRHRIVEVAAAYRGRTFEAQIAAGKPVPRLLRRMGVPDNGPDCLPLEEAQERLRDFLGGATVAGFGYVPVFLDQLLGPGWPAVDLLRLLYASGGFDGRPDPTRLAKRFGLPAPISRRPKAMLPFSAALLERLREGRSVEELRAVAAAQPADAAHNRRPLYRVAPQSRLAGPRHELEASTSSANAAHEPLNQDWADGGPLAARASGHRPNGIPAGGPAGGATLTDLPAEPGVYVLEDATGEALYVGKSVDLSRRVPSYFGRPIAESRALYHLAELTERVEVIPVSSELEALLLEARLIDEWQPPFNVQRHAGSRCLYLRLSTQEPFPRLTESRVPAADGATYFGPFRHATAARRLRLLLASVLRLRTCTRQLPAARKPRPACGKAASGACLAPCVFGPPPSPYAEEIRLATELLTAEPEDFRRLLRRLLRERAPDARKAPKIKRRIEALSAMGPAAPDASLWD